MKSVTGLKSKKIFSFKIQTQMLPVITAENHVSSIKEMLWEIIQNYAATSTVIFLIHIIIIIFFFCRWRCWG